MGVLSLVAKRLGLGFVTLLVVSIIIFGAVELLPGLSAYDDAIKHSIGLRVQERLTKEQARLVAECQSVHRNISLYF